jgi:hypothetical protein
MPQVCLFVSFAFLFLIVSNRFYAHFLDSLGNQERSHTLRNAIWNSHNSVVVGSSPTRPTNSVPELRFYFVTIFLFSFSFRFRRLCLFVSFAFSAFEAFRSYARRTDSRPRFFAQVEQRRSAS